MANEQNLRPPFTPSEAREYGKKGNIASQTSKRRKKTIAETVDKLLNEKVTDKKQLLIIEKSGMPIQGKPTYKDFLVASVIMKTIKKGNVDDLAKISDLIGENKSAAIGPDNRDELSQSLREMAENLKSDPVK